MREREKTKLWTLIVPVFFVTLEFLTLTFPRYKTETKKLKEFSRMCCQTMSLNEDHLQKLVVVHRFGKK